MHRLTQISSAIKPNFNFNCKEIDSGKNLIIEIKADSGKLQYNNIDYDIENVNVIISDSITLEATYNGQLSHGEYQLTFISDDGWRIENVNVTINNIESSYGHEIKSSLKGKFLKFKASQGVINNHDNVMVFKLLEDCKIGDSTKFTSDELIGLCLIKEKIDCFPRSTGYFVFEDLYESIENKWDEIFNNFHFLLGFFSSNFVNLRCYFIKGPEDYMEIRCNPINKSTGAGSSIFWGDRPSEISKFLNSTYENFIRYKEDLNLPIVIDYFVWMKNSPYIDSHKYLLAVILMEALKYAYASKFKSYSKSNSKFLKPTATGTKNMGFLDLIKDIYSDFGLDIIKIHIRYIKKAFKTEFNKDISDIYPSDPLILSRICKKENFAKYLKDYRNEVVHEGNIKADYHRTTRQMNFIEWSIEILLLKILGVNCYYWDSCENDWLNAQKLIKRLSI